MTEPTLRPKPASCYEKRVDAEHFEIPETVRLAIASGTPPAQAYREWRGYGVTALAMASGVTAGIVAEHEAGRRELTREECDAIGLALGVPCELLLRSP